MDRHDSGAAVHLIDDPKVSDPGSIYPWFTFDGFDVSTAEGILVKRGKATVQPPGHVRWNALVVALSPMGQTDFIHQAA